MTGQPMAFILDLDALDNESATFRQGDMILRLTRTNWSTIGHPACVRLTVEKVD